MSAGVRIQTGHLSHAYTYWCDRHGETALPPRGLGSNAPHADLRSTKVPEARGTGLALGLLECSGDATRSGTWRRGGAWHFSQKVCRCVHVHMTRDLFARHYPPPRQLYSCKYLKIKVLYIWSRCQRALPKRHSQRVQGIHGSHNVRDRTAMPGQDAERVMLSKPCIPWQLQERSPRSNRARGPYPWDRFQRGDTRVSQTDGSQVCDLQRDTQLPPPEPTDPIGDRPLRPTLLSERVRTPPSAPCICGSTCNSSRRSTAGDGVPT